GVECLVQLHGLALAGQDFHATGGGVAAEQQVVNPGKLDGFDDLAGIFAVFVLGTGHANAGSRGDVEAGFHHGIVADADTDAGVCTEQYPLAQGNLFLAAAGERTHDGGTAANVRPVTGHHSSGDAAFHHGRAEGSGVEVHEAFMHHSGALGQVRTQADTVGVGDPD